MKDLAYVQTCRRCGFKKTSDHEHESDCHGLCTSNTKKMRSFEEITDRVKMLKEMWKDNKYHIIQISVLKWVLGENEV